MSSTIDPRSNPVASLPPQHAISILTPRLLLRPVRPSDLYPLHVIRRDPETMKYMSSLGADPEPVAEKSFSVTRIQLMMGQGRFSFAIELRDPAASGPSAATSATSDASPEGSADSRLIGFIGIHRIPEVFYLLHADYWGKGYATEALKGFVGRYWKEFPEGLPDMKAKGLSGYLEGRTFIENVASGRVLEKAGFKCRRNSTVEINGGVEDNKIYQMERPVVAAAEGEVNVEA